MRIVLSLAKLAGAHSLVSLLGSVGEIERVSAIEDAVEAHHRTRCDVLVVEWSTLGVGANARGLFERLSARPHAVALVHDAAQVADALASGFDDVVASSDVGFESRLAFAVERGHQRHVFHDDVAAVRAIMEKHTGLRYLEHDLRSDRLTRVGQVAPSPRRLPSSELEGRRASSLLDEASHGNLIRAAANAISHFQQTGELSPIVVDVAFPPGGRSQGTRRFFLTLALDRDGHPTLLRGFSWDTTDLVAAVEDYRRLFEASHDAIIIFDPVDEIVLDANPKACEPYGCPRDVFIGSSLRDVSTNVARGKERVERTLDAAGVVSFDAEQVRRDGTRMQVEINASRIEYKGRTAILTVNRDVTARRKADAAARLQEKALQEGAKMEALGQLAGGIAHDFNNLLMIIATCSDVLRETLGPAHPARLEIDDIVDASERAKNLIGQLLSFGRRAPQSPRPVDLNEVVTTLHPLLRRVVGEDLQLETHFADVLPAVLADPGQLEQLLVNLVVNARDAIDGRGIIRIRTESDAESVALVVTDSGSGMDEATRARIFEPFFTTKEQGKGTGLGLSTVYAIVRDSKGSIAVDSALGKGTTFRVTFPAHDAQPESVRRSRVERNSQPGHEVILLVEDERAVRRLLARELERFGYQVIEADHGEAALEAAKQTPIDVLVTDVVMPKMSGDEVAERLKVRWPDLKVVFISGHTDRGKVRDISERGIGPLLRKPFHASELIDVIRNRLGERRPA